MENRLDEAATSVTSSSWDPFNQQTQNTDDSDWANFSSAPIENENKNEDELTTLVNSQKLVKQNPLLNLIENFILTQNKDEISFSENVPENELNMELDSAWNELKKYTSINDESLSLKFKWSLSNLEEEYLKSLNLQRKLPVQTKKPNFLLTNEILQPIKIQLIDETLNTEQESVLVDTFIPEPNLIPDNEITNSALNIDLSYFESRQENENEQDAKSKNYLNKLLNEIYATGSNGSKQDDDFNSDKKSIASNSSIHSTNSNSSNRIIKSSIKLEPLNLDKQFSFINMYDLNQKIYP